MTKNCTACGHNPTKGGCHRVYAHQPECPLSSTPDTPAERIGRDLIRELSGRSGFDHALDGCDIDIRAEIMRELGTIALCAAPRPSATPEMETILKLAHDVVWHRGGDRHCPYLPKGDDAQTLARDLHRLSDALSAYDDSLVAEAQS